MDAVKAYRRATSNLWAVSSSSSLIPACLATIRRGRRKPPVSSSKEGSSGFGTDKTVSSKKDDLPKKGIYSLPALYDLAFGYRNYEEEVDFLIRQHKKLHGGKGPERVIEMAAGPARHSIHALRSSQAGSVTALDNSPEMVEYGRAIAAEELDVDSFQTSFTYVKEDMTTFQLSEGEDPFDSAWILLGSLAHLTTNAEVIACFKSIHEALTPGGTLILELPHPREIFSLGECTRNSWEVPLEDESGEQSGELEIIWGDDNDHFDPIKQVRQSTVALQLKGAKGDIQTGLQSVREVVPVRLFTAQEIDALAHLGGFEVTSMFGALTDDVDVYDEDEAFRLVSVLQKV